MPTLYPRLLVLLFCFVKISFSQAIPMELREGLETDFHFSDDDFTKIEAGQAVAHIVPTARPDDVRMAGIVLIKASSEAFIKAFRDIESFEVSKDVVRTKRFSSPPVVADVADFDPDIKKAEILACRPGHCAYKLPAEAMTDLQRTIDWDAPDDKAKALDLIHKRIVEYVNKYRLNGDRALTVYEDSESPYSLAEGVQSIIGNETRIGRALPALIHFASSYPADKPANTEDFFYWQEAAFGLKHVLRAQHVIIQQLPSAEGRRYAIISKLLFASHYFRAAVEFKYAYPVRTPAGKPATFLITGQRSYVDGMTGAKGAIIRRVAESRSPAKLAENLQQAKQRLEAP